MAAAVAASKEMAARKWRKRANNHIVTKMAAVLEWRRRLYGVNGESEKAKKKKKKRMAAKSSGGINIIIAASIGGEKASAASI